MATKTSARVLFAALVVLSGVFTFAPGAQAAVRNPSWILNGYGEDGCVSTNWGNDVYIAQCNSSTPAHLWQRKAMGNGAYKLINNLTGRCMSMNESLDVYMVDCKDGSFAYHEWFIAGAPANEWTNLRNRGSDDCVSANGYGKPIYGVESGCNFNADGRRWMFI